MKIDLAFLKKKSEKRFTGLHGCNHPEVLIIVNHDIGPWVAERPFQPHEEVHDYESIEEMLVDYKKKGYLDGYKRVEFYPDIEKPKEVYTIPLTLINTLMKENDNENRFDHSHPTSQKEV